LYYDPKSFGIKSLRQPNCTILVENGPCTTPPPEPASILAPVDPRLPSPGTILTRPYKGQLVQVQVLTEGFAYAGRVYPSLSAVARPAAGVWPMARSRGPTSRPGDAPLGLKAGGFLG
jgi:hypothetical protein